MRIAVTRFTYAGHVLACRIPPHVRTAIDGILRRSHCVPVGHALIPSDVGFRRYTLSVARRQRSPRSAHLTGW